MKVTYILLLLLPAASAPFAYADHDAYDFDGLTVVFIDLETKGDSTLVIFPNEKTMLIDGGLSSAYPNIKEVLQSFDISTIDAVVATHPDQDHIGGLNALLQDGSIEVKGIITGPTEKETRTYQRFLSLAEGRSIAHTGDTINLDDAVSVRVLSPPESLISERRNASLENSNSVIMLLEYGDIEFLFTADATFTTESWLVNRYAADVLDVDILNAPHHGSKHASTPAFVDATTPRTVIFSANENNQYGHPHQDAVNRYAGADHLLRTHTGDIIIQTDGAGCSMFLNGNLEDEAACFGGIAVVPEFSHIMMIGIIAMIPVILLERVRMHL